MNNSPFQEAFSLAIGQDNQDISRKGYNSVDCRPLYRLASDIQLDSPDEGLAFARLVEAFETQAKEGKEIEALKTSAENAKEWLEEAPGALRDELPDYVEGLKDSLEDFAGDALLNIDAFVCATPAEEQARCKKEFEKFVKDFSDAVLLKRAAHVRSQLDKHYKKARDLAVDLTPQEEKKK